MNSSLFYTKVWVLKFGASWKNHFGSTNEFMSFQRWFVGLDENIIDHDYFDTKICLYKFWDGILIYT